ncbi:MAG: hypothetical protein ABI807_06230 [Sporichthyaceae bacterium]
MSYDIFFVRRDPGQTFEDALEGVEESYEGGDPGPLTDEDLEQWDALVPAAREILGSGAELTQDHDESRELTDPVSGIGLTLVSGELQIHVPESTATGDDDLAVMARVYDLARAVEDATGLEGYDPQLGEPVSDASDTSPTRRLWVGEDDDDEDDRYDGPGATVPAAAARGALDPEPFDPEPPARSRRWWEFWKP